MNLMLRVVSVFLGLVTVGWGQDVSNIRVTPFAVKAPSTGVWPRFRGPRGDGITSEPLPTVWSETTNVAWKTEIPGRGWSSPVIDNNLIWITTAVETPIAPERAAIVRRDKITDKGMADQMKLSGTISLYAVAVDAKGTIVRQVLLFQIDEPVPVHNLNSNASPTPALAHGRVYCHFGTNGTACVDAETGDVLWRRQYSLNHGVGPGSSPVVFDNLVILVCDGVDAQFVVALDGATGDEVWKTNRPPMKGNEGDLHKAFSTPTLIEFDGQPQLIAPCAQWFVAYNPRTGEEIWRVRHGDGFSNVPVAVVNHDTAFLCTGYMQPQLWAVRLGSKGDITESNVIWRIKKSVPNMPSPILVRDHLIFVSDQGVVSLISTTTGQLQGQRRIGGNYSASPLLANDKVYFSSREGNITVLMPDAELTEIAVNALDGQIMASPGVWGTTLILRTDSALYGVRDTSK